MQPPGWGCSVPFRMLPFTSCPIASRFIETREDALSYYAHKLEGAHSIVVGSVEIVIRFNPEEVHLFADSRSPCPECDRIRRPGRSGEVRCFSKERARLLDLVLPTLQAPAKCVRAKDPRNVLIFGPSDPKSLRRLAVVVGPGGPGLWFVRTLYPVEPKAFRAYLRSPGVNWPQK